MCFSATASFVAGSALTGAGIVSASQIKESRQVPFASIPFIFGIQQLCEGFIWLSLSGNIGGQWLEPLKFTFLIFAQVLWPFFIPLAYLLVERSERRRKFMRWLLFGGVIVSLLLAWRLVFFMSTAQINGCHVEYEIMSPKSITIVTSTLYIGAIVVSPLLTTWRWGKVLALANVISLIITHVFFEVYLVSVWCFFAAVQSVIIVMAMREMKRTRRMERPE